MPKRSPFTRLCGQFARLTRQPGADLHVHTTASDGIYSPVEVIEFARKAGLRAIAITDHDTFSGTQEAAAHAASGLELIPAIEISTCHAGREFHLLAYYLRTDHPDLNRFLAEIRESRRERYYQLAELLRARGMNLADDLVEHTLAATSSPGRRHLGILLTASGYAHTVSEAIYRYVNPLVKIVHSKFLIPLDEAIELVHAANGVASLAHPPSDLLDADYDQFRVFGLDALEVVYPSRRQQAMQRLRGIAAHCGFAISGGSDCHGPSPAHRNIGSHTITPDELAALRERAACKIR